MIYVGASPVIVQAMLGGQAGVGAEGYRELVSPKDFKKLNFEFLINGLVARRSFGAKHRDTVVAMIKATMEGTKRMFSDER